MVYDRLGEGMGKGEYDRGGEGKWCMIGWGKVWEKGSMIGVGRVSGA